MRMPCTLAYRSNACLASIVSTAVAPFCKCTNDMPLKWSTNTVAISYLLNVINPFICGINPGTADTIWSIDTTDPGAVTGGINITLIGAFVLHGRRVAFPYMHAAHLGIWHVASAAGKSPLLASCCIFRNEMCPSR